MFKQIILLISVFSLFNINIVNADEKHTVKATGLGKVEFDLPTGYYSDSNLTYQLKKVELEDDDPTWLLAHFESQGDIQTYKNSSIPNPLARQINIQIIQSLIHYDVTSTQFTQIRSILNREGMGIIDVEFGINLSDYLHRFNREFNTNYNATFSSVEDLGTIYNEYKKIGIMGVITYDYNSKSIKQIAALGVALIRNNLVLIDVSSELKSESDIDEIKNDFVKIIKSIKKWSLSLESLLG